MAPAAEPGFDDTIVVIGDAFGGEGSPQPSVAFVILRRVIQARLIALFASVVVAGILAVGLLFNALGL